MSNEIFKEMVSSLIIHLSEINRLRKIDEKYKFIIGLCAISKNEAEIYHSLLEKMPGDETPEKFDAWVDACIAMKLVPPRLHE